MTQLLSHLDHVLCQGSGGEEGMCFGGKRTFLLAQWFLLVHGCVWDNMDQWRGCARWCRSWPRRICCCGRNMHIHTDYRDPVEEKGLRAPTLALTGFYCFSRPLTSKMALLYYAEVCFGWLSFAYKGEGVAEYIKGGYLQCKRRNGWIGYAPYLEGLAQILGR